MKVIKAPVNLRAAIHAIVVGQMASVLLARVVDLSNEAACRAALLDGGFGDASTTKLLARAIAAARASLAEQGTPK